MTRKKKAITFIAGVLPLLTQALHAADIALPAIIGQSVCSISTAVIAFIVAHLEGT